MHGQYNDSKLLWKEKGSVAHMSFQSTAAKQCFSSILCASPQPYPSLALPLGRAIPVLQIKGSIFTTKEKIACKSPPPLYPKKASLAPPPSPRLHCYFKSALEKFILFGASWWIPLTGTFLLVPVFLLSPIQAVPWGFCHNNGSSEMVTEHLLTPRKVGLSHYC